MAHRPRTILGLPFLTIFFAGVANVIGAFGLVAGGFTNAYQPPDLSLDLPCTTFTNCYHRGD